MFTKELEGTLYMTLFEGRQKYLEWLRGFETEQLIKEIYNLERLIDVEGFEHTLFIDDCDYILRFMKDEVIKRMAIVCGIDVYNG